MTPDRTATVAALAWLQRRRRGGTPPPPPDMFDGYLPRVAGVLLVMAALRDRGTGPVFSVAEIATYTGMSESATRDRLNLLACHGKRYAHRKREWAVVHHSQRYGGYALDVQALWDGAR